jgi:hypothetical protein
MIRKTTLKLTAAALACGLTVLLASAVAGAAPAATVILGAAKKANASCPDDCLVEARVTGFQTAIGKESVSPFVAPSDGRIMAWSIKLGKPVKKDRRAFNDAFGPPKARIGVLRLVEGSGSPPKYKLLRQAPMENLGDFFGDTTTFALDTPLTIRAGEIVALTIKTWAPAFAVGQGMRSTWSASRNPTKKRGGCTDKEGRANVKAGAPQVKKGSQRPYGCSYDGARLLYSATFQPDEEL